MKKILYFAILACLTGLVSACSDDGMDNPYATDGALVVVSNDAMIPSVGGTGTIVVEGNGTVTAESSSEWCATSVSGNTVTVSATPNNAIESRNATVTIKSGNKSTQVSIYQEGMVFVLTEHSFDLDDSAATLQASVQLNNAAATITVGEKADWLSGQYNPATGKIEISVAANETGSARSGSIEFLCGKYAETVTVSQYEFDKDVLGTYILYWYNSSSTGWEYTNVEYERTEKGDTQLRFLEEDFEGWAIPVETDEANLTMSVYNLAPVGLYGEGDAAYQVLVFVRGLSNNTIYRHSSASIAAVGEFVNYSDGTQGWEFEGNAALGDYALYGISLGATTDGTYAGLAGWLQHFYNFQLERVAP